jgi:hypothetical protein
MWYKNGTVFNSQQDIRRDNPNTSLPSFMSEEFIASMGYVVIMDSPQPTHTEVQRVEEDGIEVINGIPMRKWKVVDMFVSMPSYTSMDGVVYPAQTKEEQEAKFYADKAEAEAKRLKAEAKVAQEIMLGSLTITTSKGNTFDANNQARLDMQNAITASDFVGVTQTVWRMADDSEVLIDLTELKEALVKAIQEYARVKGIG